MTTLDDFHQNHGEPESWAELSAEENRCLIGLKKFYTEFDDQSEQDAFAKAWVDLQTEFERLKEFKWFKNS